MLVQLIVYKLKVTCSLSTIVFLYVKEPDVNFTRFPAIPCHIYGLSLIFTVTDAWQI